jgi:hypothetical protein
MMTGWKSAVAINLDENALLEARPSLNADSFRAIRQSSPSPAPPKRLNRESIGLPMKARKKALHPRNVS